MLTGLLVLKIWYFGVEDIANLFIIAKKICDLSWWVIADITFIRINISDISTIYIFRIFQYIVTNRISWVCNIPLVSWVILRKLAHMLLDWPMVAMMGYLMTTLGILSALDCGWSNSRSRFWSTLAVLYFISHRFAGDLVTYVLWMFIQKGREKYIFGTFSNI